jgi:hypothetical protein
MINTDMRDYDYYIYGEQDDYGQLQESNEPAGTVKMSINTTVQRIQDSVIYNEAEFIGLTHDKEINDKYIVQYGDSRLKVIYVNQKGRFRQVYMARM